MRGEFLKHYTRVLLDETVSVSLKKKMNFRRKHAEKRVLIIIKRFFFFITRLIIFDLLEYTA